MKYASIDVETTGLDPEWCQIIEITCILDDLTNQRPIDDLPTFHKYVLQKRYRGEEIAISMNAAIFKAMADHKMGRGEITEGMFSANDEVGYQFASWLDMNRESLSVKRGKPTAIFAGKNVGSFDIQFLQRLPGWDGVNAYHRYVDPMMLYLLPGDPEPPSLQDCLNRAGLKRTVAHRATDDAIDVIQVLRAHYNKGK